MQRTVWLLTQQHKTYKSVPSVCFLFSIIKAFTTSLECYFYPAQNTLCQLSGFRMWALNVNTRMSVVGLTCCCLRRVDGRVCDVARPLLSVGGIAPEKGVWEYDSLPCLGSLSACLCLYMTVFALRAFSCSFLTHAVWYRNEIRRVCYTTETINFMGLLVSMPMHASRHVGTGVIKAPSFENSLGW